MTGELVVRQGDGAVQELTVDDLARQVEKIREVQRKLMKADVHYGVVPGAASPKPVLFKAGAELLTMLFRLAPTMEIVRSVETDTEITFVVRCTLIHLATGVSYGSAIASCSSRDKKYGTRKGKRLCPRCKRETIFASKEERGGGYYCWRQKGGCGAQFAPGDKSIEGQVVGDVPNPDIWDLHNTILKMAEKRAHVAAILAVTAASDAFTQDLEDGAEEPAPRPHQNSAPAPKPREQPSADPGHVAAPTGKQMRRYHQLREQLVLTEEAAREKVGDLVGRSIGSVSNELTGSEMNQVIATMENQLGGGQ